MSKTNRKRGKGLLAVIALLVLIMILAAGLFLNREYQAVDSQDQSMIEVRIPESVSAHAVAALLKQNGLIRNERVFLVYCYQKGWETQLKAGLYEFSKTQSLPQLALQMVQGKVKKSSFTIPEGYTVRQIGEMLIKKGFCSQAQWSEALGARYAYDFIPPEVTDPEKRLEGFLCPNTYTIAEDTGAQEIIDLILAEFSGVWQQEFAAQALAQQMSVRKVVTVASLVEREARVAEERKRIAGVIYNRLRKGMALQIDATVLYSLGEHREIVTYQDLEIDSPYNTYKYPGLPPGPIASPGRAAIDAALNPEVHGYYYYVAKGDGSHYFSSTYAEHLEAVQKYGQ